MSLVVCDICGATLDSDYVDFVTNTHGADVCIDCAQEIDYDHDEYEYEDSSLWDYSDDGADF